MLVVHLKYRYSLVIVASAITPTPMLQCWFRQRPRYTYIYIIYASYILHMPYTSHISHIYLIFTTIRNIYVLHIIIPSYSLTHMLYIRHIWLQPAHIYHKMPYTSYLTTTSYNLGTYFRRLVIHSWGGCNKEVLKYINWNYK